VQLKEIIKNTTQCQKAKFKRQAGKIEIRARTSKLHLRRPPSLRLSGFEQHI
jgi:hypothetical protein